MDGTQSQHRHRARLARLPRDSALSAQCLERRAESVRPASTAELQPAQGEGFASAPCQLAPSSACWGWGRGAGWPQTAGVHLLELLEAEVPKQVCPCVSTPVCLRPVPRSLRTLVTVDWGPPQGPRFTSFKTISRQGSVLRKAVRTSSTSGFGDGGAWFSPYQRLMQGARGPDMGPPGLWRHEA